MNDFVYFLSSVLLCASWMIEKWAEYVCGQQGLTILLTLQPCSTWIHWNTALSVYMLRKRLSSNAFGQAISPFWGPRPVTLPYPVRLDYTGLVASVSSRPTPFRIDRATNIKPFMCRTLFGTVREEDTMGPLLGATPWRKTFFVFLKFLDQGRSGLHLRKNVRVFFSKMLLTFLFEKFSAFSISQTSGLLASKSKLEPLLPSNSHGCNGMGSMAPQFWSSS